MSVMHLQSVYNFLGWTVSKKFNMKLQKSNRKVSLNLIILMNINIAMTKCI